MKQENFLIVIARRAMLCGCLLIFGGLTIMAQTTAFTYQGRLTDQNAAASGSYDLQFALDNGATLTSCDGAAATNNICEDVAVSNGAFTVRLDFGAAAFDGANRSLQIGVRRGAETGAFTALTPNQPITSAPYAIQSANATNAVNLGGVTATNYQQKTGDASQLTNLNASNIASGTLADARLSSNVAFRNQSNTFTGNQTINGNLTQTGASADFNLTNGFVARGTLNTGAIPAAGAGVRMMWYPNKAAFRAGYVDGTQWDNANIGQYSTATGVNTTASGFSSIALGDRTTASGSHSTAMGYFTTASGQYSTARGYVTTASGSSSTALGSQTTASGTDSTALGGSTTASGYASTALGSLTTASGDNSTAVGTRASTNGNVGSFVYGDNSTFSVINATTSNQFVVRAQNIWFGTHSLVTNTANRFIETSTGAYLSSGGTWTNSSSVDLKTNFAPVNARDVLRKVLALPVQTWNYKAESSNVIHLGATAQDFRRAFQLGADDEHISTVDADGVALAAIQGLNEQLNERAAKLQTENDALKKAFEQQQKQITELKVIVCAIKPDAEICRQ